MTMPQWEPLQHLSTRSNSLARYSWSLINKAAELLSTPTTPDVCLELQDIWEEALVVERKFQGARAVDQL